MLRDFEQEVNSAHRLVAALGRARVIQGGPVTQAQFHQVVELGYLRAYLAWESFLENSFILYVMGKRSGSGAGPRRFVTPENRRHAVNICTEGQRYADWTSIDKVVSKAERFFRGGEPYKSALTNKQILLQDMKTIRNAIAHQSDDAALKFEALVRKELRFLAPHTTVGSFLNTSRPTSAPAASFLEHYLDELSYVAVQIAG